MTRVQYNSSTLKVIYKASTDKVQVVRQHVCLLGGSSLGVDTRKYLSSQVECSTVWTYDASGHVYGIATDLAGNVYIATTNLVNKLNILGELQWSYDTGDDTWDIATDYAGNVYVVGERVDLGGGEFASVWKLDSAGDLIWTYDTGNDAWAVAVDINAKVYVGGLESGDCAGLNCSVWKLDSAGDLVWEYGTDSTILTVGVDSSLNVIVGGIASNEDWEGGGADWASVWQLDSGGNLNWYYYTGSNVADLTIDASDNIYVTGGTAGGNEVWKLNAAGVLQWDTDIGAVDGNCVALSPNEDYLLVGDDLTTIYCLKASDGSEIYDCDPAVNEVHCLTTAIGTYYVISGYVREGGAALAGVTMGGIVNNPVTDADGYYYGLVSSGWTGTVTPAKADYTFNPVDIDYVNVTSDQLNQDYVATAD